MSLEQILGLGLLQGITEFLPVSSSAHLILLPLLFGWEDQGLAFDVAVHVGTLVAVVSYFRKDVSRLILGWFLSISKRQHTQDSRLAWLIILGTIPIGLVGLYLGDLVELYLRSPIIIALATIVFGLLLWWADARGERYRDEEELTIKDAVIVGLFQILALIPGTSRSGITMTGGLFLGLTREASARFSFLLSIPIIVLAGGLKTVELIGSNVVSVDWYSLAVGFIVSTISAFACISIFLKLLEKVGMFPFVIYRLMLGSFLLYIYVV